MGRQGAVIFALGRHPAQGRRNGHPCLPLFRGGNADRCIPASHLLLLTSHFCFYNRIFVPCFYFTGLIH
jgi:hypothetical protein